MIKFLKFTLKLPIPLKKFLTICGAISDGFLIIRVTNWVKDIDFSNNFVQDNSNEGGGLELTLSLNSLFKKLWDIKDFAIFGYLNIGYI